MVVPDWAVQLTVAGIVGQAGAFVVGGIRLERRLALLEQQMTVLVNLVTRYSPEVLTVRMDRVERQAEQLAIRVDALALRCASEHGEHV